MNPKIFYLPSFVYVISFTSVLILYQIGWSNLFPKLNGLLIAFFAATIIISFGLALVQKQYLNIRSSTATLSSGFIKRSLYFICIGYILDFAYESSVPIIKVFLVPSYSYDDFNGIPTFHVILGTFNIFFSISMFDNYLSVKKRKKLLIFLFTLLPFILIINRGAIMIVFSAMIFLFLFRLKVITLKKIFIPFFVLGLVLYLFGLVGNLRQEQTKDDKEYLLRVAGATDSFIQSGVPTEFYWSYIYLISPIGNLQNIIDEKSDGFHSSDVGLFMTTQLFPDFISKRLVALFGQEKLLEDVESSKYLVTPLLNAPTVYYGSYLLLGSLGLVLMYIVIALSCLIYPFLVNKDSVYYFTSIASLNSIILLSTFNNMWYATGTIMLWPILLSLLQKIKFRD